MFGRCGLDLLWIVIIIVWSIKAAGLLTGCFYVSYSNLLHESALKPFPAQKTNPLQLKFSVGVLFLLF